MRVGGMVGGGGFLNNVDGVITGYNFTHEFPGATREDNEKQVYMVLHFLVDGAEGPVSTTLRGGGAQYLTAEENGRVLINPEGGNARLWNKSSLYAFMASLVAPIDGKAGFPDERFDEDPTVIDFTPMIGTRVRLVQEVDAEAVAKGITRKGKDKEGAEKAYKPTLLKVKSVLALPDAAAASTSGSAKQGAKPNTGADNDALQAQAKAVLVAILTAAKENTVEKKSVGLKVTQKAAADKLDSALRETLRKLISSDAFLQQQAGWTFDGTAIRLAA